MAYTAQTWEDEPAETTPFSAARMTHIEDGIAAAATAGDAAVTLAGVHGATSKTSPVDADEIPGLNSAASFGGVKFTIGTIKTYIAAAILGGAPSQLDTLDELAAALGDDANFAATVTAALAAKAPLASPAFTGVPTGVIAPGINAATAKTTPVFGDKLAIADSEAAFGLKSLSIQDLIVGIATYIAGVVMTMSNKAIIPRVGGTASIGTISFDATLTDMVILTAMAVNVTSIIYTGTAVDGQEVTLRFKDNGTSRTIAHGSQFIVGPGGALLTATVANKTHLEKFRFDAAAAKFVLIFRDATGY